MSIIQQKVIITWNSMNKIYLQNKGYIYTKMKDNIEVNVNDLQSGSKTNILCTCDYCGKEIIKSFKLVNPNRKVDYPFQLKICCNDCQPLKNKESLLAKYGVTNIRQIDNVNEKIKQTNLKKYGVENPFQAKEIKAKIEQVNLAKYGVQYCTQSEEIKLKIQQTNLKRYNGKSTMCSKLVQNKYKQTCLKKYGVDHPMKVKEIKEKVIIKGNLTKYKNSTAPCSKQQKYLCKLLNGELNYPINNLRLDIAFPEEMIYIEYDGGGHNLCVIKGDITQEEFDKKEFRRDRYLKSLGWKLIRIKCKNDKLLNDNNLLYLINQSKSYLLNTNHTWVEINLDNNKIINTIKTYNIFDFLKGDI